MTTKLAATSLAVVLAFPVSVLTASPAAAHGRATSKSCSSTFGHYKVSATWQPHAARPRINAPAVRRWGAFSPWADKVRPRVTTSVRGSGRLVRAVWVMDGGQADPRCSFIIRKPR